MGYSPERALARTRYVKWLALSDLERAAAKEPPTHAAYARKANLPERTLRKWRRDAEMSGELDQVKADRLRRERLETIAASSEVPPELQLDPSVPATADGDVSSVGVIGAAFEQLSQLVVEGDIRAIQTLLSLPIAKSYMEQQSMEFSRTFEDVSDEELQREVLAFVSTDALRAELLCRDGTA